MSFNYTTLDYSNEVFTSIHFSELLLDFEEQLETYDRLRSLYLASQSIIDPKHPIATKDPSLDIKYLINLKSFQYIIRLAQLGYQSELDFTLPADYEDRMNLDEQEDNNKEDEDKNHDNNDNNNNNNDNNNNNHDNNNHDDDNSEPSTSERRYTTYPDGSTSTHLIYKQEDLNLDRNSNSKYTLSNLLDDYQEDFLDPDVVTSNFITDGGSSIKCYSSNEFSKDCKIVSFISVVDKINEHLPESLLMQEKPTDENIYHAKVSKDKHSTSYDQFIKSKDFYVHQFHRQLKINSDPKEFYYKSRYTKRNQKYSTQQQKPISIKELPDYNTDKSTYNKQQTTQNNINNPKPPLNHNQIVSVSKHSKLKQISTNLSTIKRFKSSLTKQFNEIKDRLKSSFYDKRYFKINYNKNKNSTYDVEIKININTKHNSNVNRHLSILSLTETTHLWYKFNNTIFYKNKYYHDKTKSRYSYM